jgi:hypothetical protein
MSFETDTIVGFEDAYTAFGTTATWASATVRIIMGGNIDALAPGMGGFLQDYKFSFTCLDSEVPTESAITTAKNRLTINSVVYRVLQIVRNEGNPLVTVHCGAVDK